MAEILVKAINHTHPDEEKDRRGSYKRGMPVLVMPDGHSWGIDEGLPKFVIIKLPGVSTDRVEKYVSSQLEDTPDEYGQYLPYRRRLWKFRFEDMPTIAKNKLLSNGGLTIKVGTYDGEYDFTWSQVKRYIRNLKTDQDESDEI